MTSYAQKDEFQIQINSGLFSFKGKSSSKTSSISFNENFNKGYTLNPYGSQFGLCFGFSGNIKRVSKRNFLTGIDLGIEILRSKIEINEIYISGNSNQDYEAKGSTNINFAFLNLNPYLGYRANIDKLPIDFTIGFDLGYCLAAKEQGSATASTGNKYTANADRKLIGLDFRPSMKISTRYNKFGIYIGFSKGLVNYQSGLMGVNNESYAQLFRFGLTYLLK